MEIEELQILLKERDRINREIAKLRKRIRSPQRQVDWEKLLNIQTPEQQLKKELERIGFLHICGTNGDQHQIGFYMPWEKDIINKLIGIKTLLPFIKSENNYKCFIVKHWYFDGQNKKLLISDNEIRIVDEKTFPDLRSALKYAQAKWGDNVPVVKTSRNNSSQKRIAGS